MTGADLTNATIKVNDCGMLHKDNAYYALLAPAATPTLTITYEGDTYTYTPCSPSPSTRRASAA